jgi:hypothetical protein
MPIRSNSSEKRRKIVGDILFIDNNEHIQKDDCICLNY